MGMTDEWMKTGGVEQIDSGVMWHIQEMDKEDPLSNLMEDDVRMVFGDNGTEVVMV